MPHQDLPDQNTVSIWDREREALSKSAHSLWFRLFCTLLVQDTSLLHRDPPPPLLLALHGSGK